MSSTVVFLDVLLDENILKQDGYFVNSASLEKRKLKMNMIAELVKSYITNSCSTLTNLETIEFTYEGGMMINAEEGRKHYFRVMESGVRLVRVNVWKATQMDEQVVRFFFF